LITNTELKTFIPAIIAPCILFYESVTGHNVTENNQLMLTNGIIIGASFVISLWGAYKNHQKQIQKSSPSIVPQLTPSETEPPKIPPDQTPGVSINNPIVTQADLNKKLGGN
jgi:hypothetical protein